jgi:tetratricopeptide (TPR) repeat protein
VSISRIVFPPVAGLALAAMLGSGVIVAPAAASPADSAQAAALPFSPAVPKEAQSLYGDGHFLEAASVAKQHDTAQSLAFAARATLMHAGYLASGDAASKELKDGETLAREAVEKDPNDVEGMLELVIALGYRSREEGNMQAHRDGYGRQARHLIEKAIELAPDDPWARAAYGGWNAEVVARAGAFAAGLFYDASRKKAVASFDKAVELDPDNPVIRVEYATALVRMDPKHPDLDAIRRQLDAALKVHPKSAVDRILQDQGRELLDAVNAGTPDRLTAALKELTPFEN